MNPLKNSLLFLHNHAISKLDVARLANDNLDGKPWSLTHMKMCRTHDGGGMHDAVQDAWWGRAGHDNAMQHMMAAGCIMPCRMHGGAVQDT
eukprot:scaffold106029_cov19-Tisochrysis_lutea.AAC.1